MSEPYHACATHRTTSCRRLWNVAEGAGPVLLSRCRGVRQPQPKAAPLQPSSFFCKPTYHLSCGWSWRMVSICGG